MDLTIRTTPNKRLIIQFLIIIYFSAVSANNLEDIPSQKDDCANDSQSVKTAFSVEDYLVLGAMLFISCGIGIFYGWFGPKHENSNDFLLGGSTMGTLPMALSLAASFVTAVELLGNPAEMYTHGAQFWMICIAFILVVPLTTIYYLPVFMTLRLTSSYEYFSLRFNSTVRYLASGLYIIQMVLYTSVAVYAPALALSKVTGMNVYLAVTAVYAVCIFYASQGGMKAVIIADSFQAAVLIGSLFLIVYFGDKYIEGPSKIWPENYNTGRLELFNFNADPTIRHSFWSVVVGGTFYWLTMFCSNQASIQKYLSVERISQVKTAIWTSSIGLIIIYTINFYTGMIIVLHYKDCDPLRIKEISDSDEILPYYIISVMGHIKGVTGFFVAGIFAASLGTVASALNSLSAITIKDFLETAWNVHLPDKRGAFVAKLLSVLYGAISFGLVFIVANLGSIMQVAISFNGMVGGITLGLFSLGMFFPWANAKGSLFGSLVAVALITLMCIGQQIAIASGAFEEKSIPTSIEKCRCLNSTYIDELNSIVEPQYDPVFFIFRISYIWYSSIGFLVTILMGMLGSFATGATDPKDVPEELLSPPMKKFLYSLSDRTKTFLNIPLKAGFSDKNNTSKSNESELESVRSRNGDIRKSSIPV